MPMPTRQPDLVKREFYNRPRTTLGTKRESWNDLAERKQEHNALSHDWAGCFLSCSALSHMTSDPTTASVGTTIYMIRT